MIMNDEETWFFITLTPEQHAFGFEDIIRAEMEEIWLSSGAREGFSVWREETDNTSRIYFSPLAASIGQVLLYRFNGSPCQQPALEGLTFVLGHVFNDDVY